MKQIRENGFNEETYFAKHLEDALEYGGAWVFEVCIDLDRLPPGCWQFKCAERTPETDIVALTHYVTEKLFENEDLRVKVFESNA